MRRFRLVEDFEEIENVRVKSLDLLTVDEAEKLPEQVRAYDEWWWLRSPGDTQPRTAFVDYDGEVYYRGCNVFLDYVAVRPALTLSNLGSSNLKLYEKYIINDEEWIYMGDNRFLYEGRVIEYRFDAQSNDYETSEIKKFLNDWLKRLQNKDLTMTEA